VQYNASANDSAVITMRLYDNLPFQRQPVATDVAAYTQTINTASSDFSFDSFQFISGHADNTSTRWQFSNVAFAQNAGEAPDYVLTHPTSVLPSIIQVGTGGTTVPGAWTSGAIVSHALLAFTVTPSSYGDLYDSASGLVGGGTVAGDVYYAFTACCLDRAGDTLLPAGSANTSPYSPSAAFGGGQLVGTAPSLGFGQKYGNWGLSHFLSVNGSDGGDFSPRIDMAPARVMLYDVRIHFNASAADTASVVMYTYDNLPAGQQQPVGTNTPTYSRQANITGDFAFNAFQFISGHADANPARWRFSDVVFSRNAMTAADYLLNPPNPARGTLITLF
jgi:hypothetical protein